MDTKKWKVEKDLLAAAYISLYTEKDDTTELDEDDPKRDGPGYDLDGNKISEEDDAEDNPGEGFVKEEDVEDIGTPVDEISGLDPDPLPEPDEVDAEVDSLKRLLLNPPVDKIEEYARAGQLHVYIDMLKKKLDAAEAVKTAIRGEIE
jgi:hypothetical protein